MCCENQTQKRASSFFVTEQSFQGVSGQLLSGTDLVEMPEPASCGRRTRASVQDMGSRDLFLVEVKGTGEQ